MNSFDYIISGGGMAGLSLAYHLLKSPLRDKQILVVDREPKTENDRTWCFWSQEPTLFESILYRNWAYLQFWHPDFSKTYEIFPYRYKMLRGIDFYHHIQSACRQAPNFHFLYGNVGEINSDQTRGAVILDGVRYQAEWVFDSLFLPGAFSLDEAAYHHLWQHFKGWVIKAPKDVFSPDCPTLFDFRTPQNGAMRFMYLLPFSRREALVEYTLFSPTLLPDGSYDRALKHYLGSVLNLESYQVLEVEQGRIPMTDQPFPRFPGPRQMTIGTRGGRVKASTGYAFLRTQHDSQAIVQSLVDFGDPTHIPADKHRYQVYDSIMLEVMEKNGDRMAEIFRDLFMHNSVDRIFRFLDEESTLLDDLGIIKSVPAMPFIQALLKTGIKPGR